MSSVINNITVFDTSFASFSSNSQHSSGKFIGATDIYETTCVGLGHITTGLVITFANVTGGTVAAGITSGQEYVVSTVTTATSSFQIYADFYSSAVDITSDTSSVGAGDHFYIVRGGNTVPCKGFDNAVFSVLPTTGYDGEFRFIGSNQLDVDTDGRLTSSNFFTPLSYQIMGASSYPTIGTTYFDSTGGSATSYAMIRVDTRGVETVSMRTRNLAAGGLVIKSNVYEVN